MIFFALFKKTTPSINMSFWLFCGLLWLTPATAWSATSIAIDTRPSHSSLQLFDAKGKRLLDVKTPYIGQLPTGHYRLIIEHQGYYRESRTLFVQSSPIILRISLMPLPTSSQQRKSPSTSTKKSQYKKKKSSSALLKIPSKKASTSAPATKKLLKEQRGIKKASLMSRIPWTPLLAGVALGVAGGIFFIISEGNFAYAQEKNHTQREAYKSYQDALSQRSTGTFLLVAGGAAFVVSAFLFWHRPQKRRRRKSKYTKSPSAPILGNLRDKGAPTFSQVFIQVEEHPSTSIK